MNIEATATGTTVTYISDGNKFVIECSSEALANGHLDAVLECAANPDMTIGELWTLYRRCHAEIRLKTQSLGSYTSLVESHVLPRLGHRRARELSEADVVEWIHVLHAETGSYRSVGPIVVRLQAMLSKGVRWGLLRQNVVMQVDAFFLGNRPHEHADSNA